MLENYAYAIFVSANAVLHLESYFPKFLNTIHIIAIGDGTAQALQKANINVHEVPNCHQSEGILGLACLQKIEGCRIIIFCGKDSRSLLINSLRDRGAIVDEFVCYQRKCPNVDRKILEDLLHTHIDFIVSTSLEGLNNLWTLWSRFAHSAWLQSKTWVVISPAMRDRALQLGISKINLAQGAKDHAILEAFIDKPQRFL